MKIGYLKSGYTGLNLKIDLVLGELDPVDNEHLKISIVVQEHPFPVESLEVLLMKLGTSELHEIGME